MLRRVAVGSCLAGLASGTVHFSETFGPGWEKRWTLSKWKEKENKQGKWVASAGKWFRDKAEDTGLRTGQDSKFFGISAAFDSFSNAGRDLIVQYQVKFEKPIECGGAYLKLGPKMIDATTFSDPTPYYIMFGPDWCSLTKRIHVIFNYKGNNVAKKSDLGFKQERDGTSHLYRLVVRPDNTVRVEVDEKKVYEGSLKEDWEIANPAHVDDDELYRYPDFGFVGFDVWQAKGGTIFDNIILTDDIAEADAYAKKWKALSDVEYAKMKKSDDSKGYGGRPMGVSGDEGDDDDDDRTYSEEL